MKIRTYKINTKFMESYSFHFQFNMGVEFISTTHIADPNFEVHAFLIFK